MYNRKSIELIVKDWVKLKTGIDLSDETISQMVVDITEAKQCDIHVVGSRRKLLGKFYIHLSELAIIEDDCRNDKQMEQAINKFT